MDVTRVLLLGAYGTAGMAIARYLLQETTDCRLVLAGRRAAKLAKAHGALASAFPDNPPEVLAVDLADASSLTAAFANADFVINAASAIEHTEKVIQALLASGVAYLDTQLSLPEKTGLLRTFAQALREKGVVCITDGGFHPGVPAALVRYAGQQLDRLTEAQVYSALRIDWAALSPSPSTQAEMMAEFRAFRPMLFRRGRWQRFLPLLPYRRDFGEPFGRQSMTPMHLEEMEGLPEKFSSLQDTGFWINGFNPVLDYFLLPLITVGLFLSPRSWQSFWYRLFHWGLRFSRPPFPGVRLDLEARNAERSIHLRLFHPDAYAMTSIPVVACFLQWKAGLIREPGLHYQALVVEPTRFLEDMGRMGVEVR